MKNELDNNHFNFIPLYYLHSKNKEENNSNELDSPEIMTYINNPDTSDFGCIVDIERAKADIKQGR